MGGGGGGSQRAAGAGPKIIYFPYPYFLLLAGLGWAGPGRAGLGRGQAGLGWVGRYIVKTLVFIVKRTWGIHHAN